MRIVFVGLSITSSWGNGHATNYRGLARALAARGHDVVFLERDVPWYAQNRDVPAPPYARTHLYASVGELRDAHHGDVAEADAVVVGSYVPDGRDVARWVLDTATGVRVFYDIDTPVTLAAVERGECTYLDDELIPRFDLYLSFTGGPTLERLERRFGARRARAFYCLVDPDRYAPVDVDTKWDLGYLGTYGADRQGTLDRLMLEPARTERSRRFVVAGPQYPPDIVWPANVDRVEHLPPSDHAAFYCSQRMTLNVTRADMVRSGWSPSVRIFEAAACGVPIVTDPWPGLGDVLSPGREILVADGVHDTRRFMAMGDDTLREIAERARERVLSSHTAVHRAQQLEADVAEVAAGALR